MGFQRISQHFQLFPGWWGIWPSCMGRMREARREAANINMQRIQWFRGHSCWQTNKCDGGGDDDDDDDDDDDAGGAGGGGTTLVNPQSLTSEDDLCCHRKRRACQLRGRGQQEALRGAGSLKGNGQQNLFSHKIGWWWKTRNLWVQTNSWRETFWTQIRPLKF